MLKNIWHDPVWSKVIAVIIVAALTAVAGLSWAPIGAFLAASSLPNWVLGLLGLIVVCKSVILLTPAHTKMPSTLAIVQDFKESRWGNEESPSGKPAMRVVFEGRVTDISGRPNRVLRAEIPKPLTHAQVLLLDENHNATRPQVLSPDECTGLLAIFSVQPVVGKERQAWHAPVIFIDQYDNRHKIKQCVFRFL